MSERCREVAGILFKKRCKLVATQACSQCQKPTCHLHIRVFGGSPLCISCGRAHAAEPGNRQSMGHLRDDPYFYWYYESGHWFHDDYAASDYDVFSDHDGGDFGADVDDNWQGT